MNTVKNHVQHGFSQFELSKNILNNLSQFNLKPIAKLVLLYLCDCYNPTKKFIFPKQKTIAEKLGVSEVSVIRAISELHKQGLIISERKYTLRYRFTSKIVSESSQIEQNILTDETLQKDSKQSIKMIAHNIEQKRELNKPTNVDDFKILKDYAESKGAKNVTAYIKALKQSGSAGKIIKEYKIKRGADRFYANQYRKTLERNQAVRNFEGIDPKSHKGMQEVLKQLRR